MRPVHITAQAREDIIGIWLHIAAENEWAADRVFARLESRCGELGQFPELGMARPDIAEGARCLVCDSWLILYRLLGASTEIVRVVHGARDLRRIGWPD